MYIIVKEKKEEKKTFIYFLLNIHTKTLPIATKISTQVKSLSPLETDLGFLNV